MSGVSQQQPITIILNSKYKRSTETVGDVTYQLQVPIHGAQRARIHQMSLVYLAHLVRTEQAQLDFTINAGSAFNYSISLASMTDKYYDDIADVVADINAIMAATFVDGSGPYNSALLPTFAYVPSTRSITVTCSSPFLVRSANNNFWYKLGWSNGTYAPATLVTSPSWPSVIPLQELYIEIDGMLNDSALIVTDSTSYHNNPAIAEVVTMSNTRLGDLYSHQFPTVPTYPLICQPSISNIRVRLMDSTGQVITSLDSDYRMSLSFSY